MPATIYFYTLYFGYEVKITKHAHDKLDFTQCDFSFLDMSLSKWNFIASDLEINPTYSLQL